MNHSNNATDPIIHVSEPTIRPNELPEPPTPPSQPIEQLSIQPSPEDETTYPSGPKLWLSFLPLLLVSLLSGLNLAIVAATIPTLTDHFHSVRDIGWYSSAYSLTVASFTVSYGKLYSCWGSAKGVYLVCLAVWQVGSVVCTLATSSAMFIVGRAVVGMGAAGIGSGTYVILAQLFPRRKRPLWITVAGSAQGVGLVSAPLLGGALIDWVGWRGCFGFSIPVGVLAIVSVAFGYEDRVVHRDAELSWLAKLKRFDWIGTGLMMPAFICLLLALQTGGVKYRWSDARVVVLLILFALLISAFAYRQYQLKDDASLPLRIIRKRSVLAACWFSSCANASLTVIEYYMSIFFQGVKGYTASQSGIHMTSLLVCIVIGGISGGLGVRWLGYYNPFMIATTLLAPVASGLLTTIKVDENAVKILCLLGFLGLAVGIGLQGPVMALQSTMNSHDLPIAIAALSLLNTLSSSVWVVVSASLFTARLRDELAIYSPSVNITQIENAGLSDIRTVVGSARLGDVLLGYDTAVTQTLYLPVGLTAATILGSALIEWHPLKRKTT